MFLCCKLDISHDCNLYPASITPWPLVLISFWTVLSWRAKFCWYFYLLIAVCIRNNLKNILPLEFEEKEEELWAFTSVCFLTKCGTAYRCLTVAEASVLRVTFNQLHCITNCYLWIFMCMCEIVIVSVRVCVLTCWVWLYVLVGQIVYVCARSVILPRSEISCSLIFTVDCRIVHETDEFFGLLQFMMLHCNTVKSLKWLVMIFNLWLRDWKAKACIRPDWFWSWW